MSYSTLRDKGVSELEAKALEIFNKTIKCTVLGKCSDCVAPLMCLWSNKTEILAAANKETK